jgi:hypothetical protein
VLNRAEVKRYEEEALHLFSATEIKIRILEMPEFVILQGEYDTLVVPFKDIQSIHVYEMGATTA